MPSRRKPSYIDVDRLMPKVSLELVAAYYGVPLPELKKIGREIRSRCFLNCGRSEATGERALAVKADDPAKKWHCHQYGCGMGGNLVSLCDLLKPGENMGGRPRAQRFKEIAADLQAIAGGEFATPIGRHSEPQTAESQPPEPTKDAPRCNVPLKRSANERARALTDLDAKFLVEPGEAMNKHAASYFRQRSFLSPEVCRKWRVGYLPRDSGGDNAGGTMRGKIVYPVLSEKGELLTWFGRDPRFEEKHAEWQAKAKQGREPQKYHFVKGFHRGLELFGQQAGRLEEPGYPEAIGKYGLIVVEGPNDVIRLDCLGVPAVGLCSNVLTAGQREKIVRWANQLAGGRVTLFFDCDEEGADGTKQALYSLAHDCSVRLAWSPESHGGKFRGRQPESLTAEEWQEIAAPLAGRVS